MSEILQREWVERWRKKGGIEWSVEKRSTEPGIVRVGFDERVVRDLALGLVEVMQKRREKLGDGRKSDLVA